MAKRMTDTDLWKKQRWFRKLLPLNKLIFCYIKDQCDHAGIWNIDCSDLIEDLGLEEINLPELIESVNVEFDKITGNKITKERLRIIDEKYLWITGFIQFQYENKAKKVSWEAAPVRTALIVLQGFSLLDEALLKGYITLTQPLHEGWQTPKDKDKDRDKDSLNNANKKNGQSKDFKVQRESAFISGLKKRAEENNSD